MGRSQRHRLHIQGVVGDDVRGQTPSGIAYSGSRMRAGATAGANTKSRAGGSTAENGAAGANTIDVAGYAGTVTKGLAATTHVDGSTGARTKMPF